MEPATPVNGPPSATGQSTRFKLRWLCVVSTALIVLATLFAAGRILFYRQTDDEQHLAAKREYLESIAGLATNATAAPNIVVILFDDLGLGDLGVYGGEAIATPRLDRLAAEGLIFRNAYSPSPYCSASRAGLLTGRLAVRAGLDHVVQVPWSWQDALERLGGLNRRLPAEEITLPEVLRVAGYATAIVGKWHLGDESPSLPNDRGFDSFYGLLFSNDQVGHLRAVREGRFKYHDRHRISFGNPPGFRLGFWVSRGPWLFDLDLDPDESYDVSVRYPGTHRRMAAMLEAKRRELEENPRGWR